VITDKRKCGNQAESLARAWLESKGYQTIESNYNRKFGEIDLIMRAPEGEPIVFVEVRFRATQSHGGALESVDRRKQLKLLRTATAWLQHHADSRTQARIDVIGIEPANSSTNESQLWQGHQMTWIVNAVEQ
jgi:putative endonuclease